MKRTTFFTKRDAVERKSLWRRVKRFYVRFNKADWDGCYALIDPQLTEQGKVEHTTYSKLMQDFKDVYGNVSTWLVRLSLHLDPTPKQGDKRSFAYVYVIWQDDKRGFHMFRERWIKEDGQWFTRVVGLVPNSSETTSRRSGLPEDERRQGTGSIALIWSRCVSRSLRRCYASAGICSWRLSISRVVPNLTASANNTSPRRRSKGRKVSASTTAA